MVIHVEVIAEKNIKIFHTRLPIKNNFEIIVHFFGIHIKI